MYCARGSRRWNAKCSTRISTPPSKSLALPTERGGADQGTTSRGHTTGISPRARKPVGGVHGPGDGGAVAGELFVDTSAWYALAVRRDRDHGALSVALQQQIQRGSAIVTTNLVVAETHALLMRRTTRGTALAFVRHVDRVPNVVVRSTRALEARAVADWLERYADQQFSFTDAVSFAVMAERAITEALTLDRHFATAGFRMRP